MKLYYYPYLRTIHLSLLGGNWLLQLRSRVHPALEATDSVPSPSRSTMCPKTLLNIKSIKGEENKKQSPTFGI